MSNPSKQPETDSEEQQRIHDEAINKGKMATEKLIQKSKRGISPSRDDIEELRETLESMASVLGCLDQFHGRMHPFS